MNTVRELGQAYCSRSVNAQEGLEDLINKIGIQTGFFGPEPSPFNQTNSNPDPEANYTSSPPPNPSFVELDHDIAVELILTIDNMSIKELINNIDKHGGKWTHAASPSVPLRINISPSDLSLSFPALFRAIKAMIRTESQPSFKHYRTLLILSTDPF
jgi:hypothetical protein